LKTLSTDHRRQLERTVVEARDIAEAGARGALEALAVHHHEPYGHMSGEQRKLRNRLRAHARHLGDRVDARSGAHAIDHLVHECAYEHWHGMLFARFLAENHLLIEPEIGVAITLDECEELAKEECVDKWALAARFAHRMLPQVFRPDHPVFEIQFAREYRLKLEGLVEGPPAEMFRATDALGWVYQFWQTKKKDEINRSEVKIGADELPAVTQLFTELYMVQFLLHNSLGAWWVSRHPDKSCPVDLMYLRRTEDGTPAAGAFEGWPDDLAEFRMLDPCCGSGHFLVAAFLMLVPMRMALERFDTSQAVDAVLRENIHGLELDQRCVAIAAFALALEAWRFPDAGSFRTLPKLNLAWCGQPVCGKKEQWLALAEGNARVEAGMAALYETFRDAPTLGSLIDPARSVPEDMLTAGFEELKPLLEIALRTHGGEEEWEEAVIAARGLVEASRLLSGQYHLAITNPPFLGLERQAPRLESFVKRHYSAAKRELALCFFARIQALLTKKGVSSLVLPGEWTFVRSNRTFREKLLLSSSVRVMARLGSNSFTTTIRANPLLFISSEGHQHSRVSMIDVSAQPFPGKAKQLIAAPLECAFQGQWEEQLDYRMLNLPGEAMIENGVRIETFCDCRNGLSAGDGARFEAVFWEVDDIGNVWELLQSSTDATKWFGGRDKIVRWEQENGQMAALAESVKHLNHAAQNWRRGKPLWGMSGVVVNQIGALTTTYTGERYDASCFAIAPVDTEDVAPLIAYAQSGTLRDDLKRINPTWNLKSPKTLLQLEVDLARWRSRAAADVPSGIPAPFGDELSQWVFHGHPCRSVVWDETKGAVVEGPLRRDATVLQVAAARLLGYHWPAEKNASMVLANSQRACIASTKRLYPFEDADGIVCIPSVRGERPAQERLLQILLAAYGDNWNDVILTKLLGKSGCASLDDWLRNRFFDEHCKLFQYRPFIWHIWDGRKRDGFHALVNYHKLAEGDGKGRRLLESLTYSYLGDWIARQQDGVKRGEGGAEDRLAAALELQKRLVSILEGEPPFDVFVRWKPIEEQPIGWDPDINDGVRLNIRPFMAQDLPGGKKGAGILRAKPNMHWKKDRGKEPTRDQAQFPWFWKNGKFTGERVNDVHLTNAEKRAAREAASTAAKGK
jgi:hypothetical protein